MRDFAVLRPAEIGEARRRADPGAADRHPFSTLAMPTLFGMGPHAAAATARRKIALRTYHQML
jgi:hypothetical protein